MLVAALRSISQILFRPLAEKRAQLRQVRRALQKLSATTRAITTHRAAFCSRVKSEFPKQRFDLQSVLPNCARHLVVSRTTYTDTYYRRQPTEQEQAFGERNRGFANRSQD